MHSILSTKLFVLSLIFFLFQTLYAQPASPYNYFGPVSPGGKYESVMAREDAGDLVTAQHMYCLNKETGDTLFQQTTAFRDNNPPHSFWSMFRDDWIVEGTSEYRRHIMVFGSESGELLFTATGFFNSPKQLIRHHYDQTNGFVFYWSKGETGRAGHYQLNKLDLQKMEVEKLGEVQTSGDPYTGSPFLTKLDTLRRKLQISYEPPEILDPEKPIASKTIEIDY